MRLLFDQNLSHRLPSLLVERFPGSTQVRLVGLDRASDDRIRRWAAENVFTLVTLDADFAEMASLYGPPPKILWLRCGNRPTRYVRDLITQNADRILDLETDDCAVLEMA